MFLPPVADLKQQVADCSPVTIYLYDFRLPIASKGLPTIPQQLKLMTEQQTNQGEQLSHQIELLIPVALTNEYRAAKLDRICDLPDDLLTSLDSPELAQLITASTCSPSSAVAASRAPSGGPSGRR